MSFYQLSLLSENNKSTTLSILGAVSSMSLAYAVYRLIYTDKKKKIEIPTPKPCYPYVGHMFSLGDLPGKKVSEWHTTYGPIIKVKMGIQTWIMIGDPVLAHELFVTKYGIESAGRHYNTFISKYYSMGQRGIAFTDATSSWRKARSVVLNVLAPRAVENYMDLIDQGSRDLAERLIEATKNKGGVNPVDNFDFYSLNIICKVTLNKQFKSVEDPDFKRVTEIIARSIKYGGFEYDLPSFLPIIKPIFYFLGLEKMMGEFVNNERNVEFRKLITESREKNTQNIVSALIQDKEHFDEDDILAIVSDTLGAGSETVSTSLCWAICILCNYPAVQEKMQNELDAFINKNERSPIFADRLELPYCVSVMKECMRYKSVTCFGIPHRATKEINIQGYSIPKDSILITSMDFMHMGSGHYSDQEKFYPERFMKDPKTMSAASSGKISERDHFNFGWGRRICPGIYLAEVEIFHAFVEIFSKSTVEPIYENGKAIYPNMIDARSGGITTLPLPFSVRFVERTLNHNLNLK